MDRWNPLEQSRKKLAFVLLIGLLALGSAAGIELLHRSSGRGPLSRLAALLGHGRTPDDGPGAPTARRRRYEELLSLFRERSGSPVAVEFARKFLMSEELRTAWSEFERTDDIDRFVETLRGSRPFLALLDRYGQDPEFRRMAEGLSIEPALRAPLRALEEGKAAESTPHPRRERQKRQTVSGLEMIRSPDASAGRYADPGAGTETGMAGSGIVERPEASGKSPDSGVRIEQDSAGRPPKLAPGPAGGRMVEFAPIPETGAGRPIDPRARLQGPRPPLPLPIPPNPEQGQPLPQPPLPPR
ncbi:MAG: hypothetical protein WC728_05705 [Elusimicrobiota bacterium]